MLAKLSDHHSHTVANRELIRESRRLVEARTQFLLEYQSSNREIAAQTRELIAETRALLRAIKLQR